MCLSRFLQVYGGYLLVPTRITADYRPTTGSGRAMDELEEVLGKLEKKRALREARERRQIRKDLAQGLIDDHENDGVDEVKSPLVQTRVARRPRLRIRFDPFRYGFLSATTRKCSA